MVILSAKLALCGMVVFAYPLLIYVVNQVIEYNIFYSMPYSEVRKWLKNLSRTIVVIAATIIANLFYYKLHQIYGFFGVILGSIIVMIVPSLIHNEVMNPSTGTRCCNWFLIVFAIVISITITVMLII